MLFEKLLKSNALHVFILHTCAVKATVMEAIDIISIVYVPTPRPMRLMMPFFVPISLFE